MSSPDVIFASAPPTSLSVTMAIVLMALAYVVLAWRHPVRVQRSTSAMAILVGLLYLAGMTLWICVDESARSEISPERPPDIVNYLMNGFGAAGYIVSVLVVALLYYRRWHLVIAWGLGASIAAVLAGIGYYLYGVLQLVVWQPKSEVSISPNHLRDLYLTLRNMQITGTFYGFWFGPFLSLIAYLFSRKKQYRESLAEPRPVAACLVALFGGLWMLVWGAMTIYAYHYGETSRLEESEGGIWLSKGIGVLYTVFCGHYMFADYISLSFWLYFGLVAGVMVILGAILSWVGTGRGSGAGILILAAASVGLGAGAGGFLGGLLGIIGGMLALKHMGAHNSASYLAQT